MLTELTQKQKDLMPVLVKEWTELATSGDAKIDEAAIVEGCYWLAELAGLKKPSVVIVHSPKSAQIVANKYAQPGAKLPEVESYLGKPMPSYEGKLKYFLFSSYGNVLDFDWSAYYDYFCQIGAIQPTENFKRWLKFIRSGVFDMIQLDGLFVVSTRAKRIYFDDRKRLHSTSAPAISWPDGYALYRLHGVRFKEAEWRKIVEKQMSAQDILSMKNIEARMAALKVLGESAVLNPADVTVLDTSKALGHELISVKNLIPGKTLYALRYRCPSTKELFVSFVPEEWAAGHDADEAMARKHKMTKADYLKLDVHT